MSEAGGVYKLKIAGLTMDDAGEYGVEFTNRAGDKKMSAELKVHCKLILVLFNYFNHSLCLPVTKLK